MNQSQSSDQWIGQDIGNGDNLRYHVEKLIGRGGTGEVFVALDNQLGRRVALKILRTHLSQDSKMRRHFEREVSLCTAIKSEHVVMVSDFGITADGHPFYVMELLKGYTLRQLLQEKHQLTIEQTKQMALQICEGLEQAHQGVNLWSAQSQTTEMVKVIHCDLKPDNIFLIPTVFGELVKILDFGIARLSFIEDNNSTVPISGGFWGTFRYAAPEQIEEYPMVDERADIYSLGMMLYEMLSGTDPFGLSGQETPGMSWALAHTNKAPTPLRRQPNTQHIPKDLESIVMRCIEKKPEKRIASVTDLKAALIMVQAGTSVATMIHPAMPRRNWAVGLGVIASVVTLSVTLSIGGMLWWEVKQHEQVLRKLHAEFRYEDCVNYAKQVPYASLPAALVYWEDQCLLAWGGDLGGIGIFKESFDKLLSIHDRELKKSALEKIDLFAKTILERGENYFQEGKWELAIVDAKVIPTESSYYENSRLAIQRWKAESAKAMEQYDKVKNAYAKRDWLTLMDTAYCFPKIEEWEEKIAPMVSEAKTTLQDQGIPIPIPTCAAD